MARLRTKSELKKLFQSLGRKAISTGMMHELIELLWRGKAPLTVTGIIPNLTSHTVSVTFKKPNGDAIEFAAIPLTILMHVFRMADNGAGRYEKQNVGLSYATTVTVTTTGFEFEIDAAEALAGILVEFKFEEVTIDTLPDFDSGDFDDVDFDTD